MNKQRKKEQSQLRSKKETLEERVTTDLEATSLTVHQQQAQTTLADKQEGLEAQLALTYLPKVFSVLSFEYEHHLLKLLSKKKRNYAIDRALFNKPQQSNLSKPERTKFSRVIRSLLYKRVIKKEGWREYTLTEEGTYIINVLDEGEQVLETMKEQETDIQFKTFYSLKTLAPFSNINRQLVIKQLTENEKMSRTELSDCVAYRTDAPYERGKKRGEDLLFRLKEEGVIQKVDRSTYALTEQGKRLGKMLQKFATIIERKGRPSNLLSNNTNEELPEERLSLETLGKFAFNEYFFLKKVQEYPHTSSGKLSKYLLEEELVDNKRWARAIADAASRKLEYFEAIQKEDFGLWNILPFGEVLVKMVEAFTSSLEEQSRPVGYEHVLPETQEALVTAGLDLLKRKASYAVLQHLNEAGPMEVKDLYRKIRATHPQFYTKNYQPYNRTNGITSHLHELGAVQREGTLCSITPLGEYWNLAFTKTEEKLGELKEQSELKQTTAEEASDVPSNP